MEKYINKKREDTRLKKLQKSHKSSRYADNGKEPELKIKYLELQH